jgi:hypothetical protein
VRHARPHAAGKQFDQTGLPPLAFGVLLQLAAGGQQPPVQAEQFGTAGDAVPIQEVGHGQPGVLAVRLRDDGTEKVLQFGHAPALLWTRPAADEPSSPG